MRPCVLWLHCVTTHERTHEQPVACRVACLYLGYRLGLPIDRDMHRRSSQGARTVYSLYNDIDNAHGTCSVLANDNASVAGALPSRPAVILNSLAAVTSAVNSAGPGAQWPVPSAQLVQLSALRVAKPPRPERIGPRHKMCPQHSRARACGVRIA